jgi:hypothetical protein
MPLIQMNQVSPGRHAAIFPADARWATWFRLSLLILGGVLGLYSLWQLTVAFVRPVTPYFLSVPAQAVVQGQSDPDKERTAATAARIGWLDGGGWFDDALLSVQASRRAGNTAQGRSALADARGALIRSARLAPHDARTWLLLAMVDADLAQHPRAQVEALKMSYYTGPNDTALIPWRLALAVRSSAIGNPDFQSLVSGEIRAALHKPALQGAILSSYQRATADGKRFLETSVGALDASLLAKMQAGDKVPLHD